ncbi:MAG: YbdD/YjiX family protein [bacterium]
MAAIVERIANVIRRVIGVPDYERYLDHQRRCHTGEPPLSREAFAKDALARRYSQPGSRCC